MKVTTKGQVTIPAHIRDFLDIAPHADVDFRIRGKQVFLVKQDTNKKQADRFQSLRGVLKDGPTTDQWMRETRGD